MSDPLDPTGIQQKIEAHIMPLSGRMAGALLYRVPDPPALHILAAQQIIAQGRAALTARGTFRIALSGGTTPRGVHEVLAGAATALDWSRVEFYFGDDRSVPPDHPDSNFGMAKESLFEPLGIKGERIHRMQGEEADLDQAARAYEAEVLSGLGAPPRFDLILMGMGNDGHTASLFPNTAVLLEHDRLVVANEVPQLKTWRLTFTYPLLRQARGMMFLVAGVSKAAALEAVLEGPDDPTTYPSQAVQLEDGTLIWMVDEAAASRLHQFR